MIAKIFLIGALTLLSFSCSRVPSDEEVGKKLRLPPDFVKKIRLSRGAPNRTLEKIPEGVVPRLAQRLAYGNIPVKRGDFRKLQQLSENGLIRENCMERAVAELRSFRLRTGGRLRRAGIPVGRSTSPVGLLPPTAGLSPAHTGWTWLGPSNIGGRTRSLVIHPANPQLLYAGSVGGGLWRSEDGGSTWVPVDDLMANMAVSTIAMDPVNAKVIYAGTGEGFGNLDALRGAGIFQTTDGIAWRQLPATINSDFHFVNRLAVSSDGKILLAATRTGLHRTADPARATWSLVRRGDLGTVLFHPSDPLRAVAAGLSGSVFFSTDGGATWTASSHADDWNGRVELTYARKDPNIVYASVNINSGEIWRSGDGGKSFVKRKSSVEDGSPAGYLGDQGWYDNVVWAGDPTNADLVIVGGIDLWRSTNGGDMLTDISAWFRGESAHADHHLIVAHPAYNGTSNKTVFFGNDGGLAKATDVSTVGSDENRIQGWQRLSHSLGVTQFYGGAVSAAGKIVGGAQDNGTLVFSPATGAAEWTTMFGGDGGWCGADPTNANLLYGEYVHLNIHRSLDAGKTAEFISGQFFNRVTNQWTFKPPPFMIPDARDQSANFIAPFVLDPNNPDRILGGGLSLWQTTDAKAPNTSTSGPRWASIKTATGVPISAIAIAKGNSAHVWVGHNNGDIFVSSNATAAVPSWKKVDDGPKKLPNRFCLRIAVDSKSTKVVYTSFGGFEKNNVWKTSDGGATWQSIGGTLPAAPIRAVAIHPKKSQFVYLGTEVGVFASEDGGNTWSATNEGPTSTSVDDLFWKDNTLYAATHGRGMFKIDLPLP